jgi:hypothetical protein
MNVSATILLVLPFLLSVFASQSQEPNYLDNENNGIIQLIPKEILLRILESVLDQAINLRRVCRSWKSLADDLLPAYVSSIGARLAQCPPEDGLILPAMKEKIDFLICFDMGDRAFQVCRDFAEAYQGDFKSLFEECSNAKHPIPVLTAAIIIEWYQRGAFYDALNALHMLGRQWLLKEWHDWARDVLQLVVQHTRFSALDIDWQSKASVTEFVRKRLIRIKVAVSLENISFLPSQKN